MLKKATYLQAKSLLTHDMQAANGLHAPTAALLQSLGAHMLPYLSAMDLVRLSCTSKALRQWVQNAPITVWKTAAQSYLPASHPILTCGSSLDLVQAMSQYTEAQKNITAGLPNAVHVVEHSDKLYTSATGARFAVKMASQRRGNTVLQDVIIYDADTCAVRHTITFPGLVWTLRFSQDEQVVYVFATAMPTKRTMLATYSMQSGARLGSIVAPTRFQSPG